jgi:hypothetical protein
MAPRARRAFPSVAERPGGIRTARRGVWPWCGATLLAVLAILMAGDAGADPQASAGLTVGGGVENVVGPPGSTGGAFYLGGRGSILFLRNRGADMALGPYLDVATASFHNVDLGGGLEWLLPVRDDLPIVLSAGAFWREGEGRSFSPGMEGTVFFGSRSYNFHSWYGLAAGLFAQTRWVPSSPSTLDLVFGLQIDAEILALPSILIIEVLRH